MSDETKPTVPDVLARFQAYYDANPSWGSLHIVLDDGNVHDDHVRWCIDSARESGDAEGAALAEILLRMSKTQRREIPKRCSFGWRPAVSAPPPPTWTASILTWPTASPASAFWGAIPTALRAP